MQVYGSGTLTDSKRNEQDFWLHNAGEPFYQHGDGTMFEVESNGNNTHLQHIYNMQDCSSVELLRIINLKMRNANEIQLQRNLLLRMVKQNMEIQGLKRELDYSRLVEAESSKLIQSTYQELFHPGGYHEHRAAEEDESWASCDSIGLSNMEDYNTPSISGEFAGMAELSGENVCLSRYREKLSSFSKSQQRELMRDLLEHYNLDGYSKDHVSSSSAGLRRNEKHKMRSIARHLKKPNQISNMELFKTEMCRSWTEHGMCPYGKFCRFAHGYEELRVRPKPHKYKTEKCKKFLAGYCPYGSRCCFVHDPNEQYRKSDLTAEDSKLSPQSRSRRLRWRSTPVHIRKKGVANLNLTKS